MLDRVDKKNKNQSKARTLLLGAVAAPIFGNMLDR
jgi:hypothetical protein